MTGGRNDPRPARSRARLLDAATALLRSGGPSAVTVDAVTRAANVARATLYRHFPSGNDLLAAAFHALIPPAPTPPAEGSLRDRLIALVQAQADLIAEAPVTLTAMSWLTLGGDLERLPGAPHRGSPESPRCTPCASASPSSTRRRSRLFSAARRRLPNSATSTAPRRRRCCSARSRWESCRRCRTSTIARSRSPPSTASSPRTARRPKAQRSE